MAIPPTARTLKTTRYGWSWGAAYATDDSGSEANTASATAFPSRSWRAWASGIGGPTSNRFSGVSRIRLRTLLALRARRYVCFGFLRDFNDARSLFETGLTADLT